MPRRITTGTASAARSTRLLAALAGAAVLASVAGAVVPAQAATAKPGTACLKSQLNKRIAYTSTKDLRCQLVGKKYQWVAVAKVAPVAAPTTAASRTLFHTDFYKLDEFTTGSTSHGTAIYADEKFEITATDSTGISIKVPGHEPVANIAMTLKYKVLNGAPRVYLSCYNSGASYIALGIIEGVQRSYQIFQSTPAGSTILASGVLPLEYQKSQQTEPLTIACTGTPGGPGEVGIGYAKNSFVGTAKVAAMPPVGPLAIWVTGPGRVQFDDLVVGTV